MGRIVRLLWVLPFPLHLPFPYIYFIGVEGFVRVRLLPFPLMLDFRSVHCGSTVDAAILAFCL